MPGPTKRSNKRSADAIEENGNVGNGVPNGADNNAVAEVSKGEVIAVFTPVSKRLKIVDSEETAAKIVEDAKGLFDCEIRQFFDMDEFKLFQAELNGEVPRNKVRYTPEFGNLPTIGFSNSLFHSPEDC